MISVCTNVPEVHIFWENLWPALCSELVAKTAGLIRFSWPHTYLDVFVAVIFRMLCPNTTWSLKTQEVLDWHVVHSFTGMSVAALAFQLKQ